MKKVLSFLIVFLFLFSSVSLANERTYYKQVREDNRNGVWTFDLTDTYSIEFDYDGFTDSNARYIGFAPAGTLDDDDTAWILYQFTYDVDRQLLDRKTSFDSWDNRAVAVYS